VAQLALRASRPIAAVVNARLAVENSLNAALAQRGFQFSGDKWLGERLDAEMPKLASLYEPFRQLPVDPGRGCARFVKAAVSMCAEMWELELELDALAPLARWHSTEEVCLAEVGSDRFLLAPHSGAIWEFAENEVDAWRRLPRPDGEEQDDDWALSDCHPEGLALCVCLYEQGLLSLNWIEGVPIGVLDLEERVWA
jgi:hypothetical protein